MKRSEPSKAIAAALVVALSACAATPPATPAQAALAEREHRFQTTLGTGIAAGAGLGLLTGLLACRGSAGCIAASTAVGGTAGGAAGWYVGAQNAKHASAEEAVQARIAAAQQENDAFAADLVAIRRVAAESRDKVAQLRRELREGTLARGRADVARAELARDRDSASRLEDQMRASSEHIAHDIETYQTGNSAQLTAQHVRLEQIRTETQAEVDALAQALGAVPAS